MIAPITAEGAQLLNTNADTIASCIAIALSQCYKIRLVYCFEKNGVLTDRENNESVIPLLDENYYTTLLQSGAIATGMIPKLDNAFLARRSGVNDVIIGNGMYLLHLFNHQSGTRIEL